MGSRLFFWNLSRIVNPVYLVDGFDVSARVISSVESP